MKTDLSKWAVLFAALLIISASMGNSFAQEVDPVKRFSQVMRDIVTIEGRIQYNKTIRDRLAEDYVGLSNKLKELSALMETLQEKIKKDSAKKAEEKPNTLEQEAVTGIE